MSYKSLSTAGFVVLSNHGTLRLTGDDRQTLFQNFCTNEVKSLTAGQLCETFVLNGKGKILGHVHALAGKDLCLIGHDRQSETLRDHLDKYVIREDVEFAIEDHSMTILFLTGSELVSRLSPLLRAKNSASAGEVEFPSVNEHRELLLGDAELTLAHLEAAGLGYVALFPKDRLGEMRKALVDAGIQESSLDDLEILRVQQGTPWFGKDSDLSNLPQELQRDEQAICFTKGCYLGQETVARIDARGRVNQLLVKLVLEESESTLEPGMQLLREGAVVGRITSVARDPIARRWNALGFVRRQFHEPGNDFDVAPAPALETSEPLAAADNQHAFSRATIVS